MHGLRCRIYLNSSSSVALDMQSYAVVHLVVWRSGYLQAGFKIHAALSDYRVMLSPCTYIIIIIDFFFNSFVRCRIPEINILSNTMRSKRSNLIYFEEPLNILYFNSLRAS